MDTILEKLGIYDLFVVLLTGMIIMLFILKLLPFYGLDELDKLGIQINDTTQFLICSYFIGMLFQEIGYLICRPSIEDKILENAFKAHSTNYHVSLTQKEIDFIMNEICYKLHEDISNLNYREIYIYCKNDYLKTSNEKIEIEQQASKASMARSLFLFFYVNIFCLSFKYLSCFDKKVLLYIFFNLICVIVFYNRYIRFYMRRYVHILRTFYYKKQLP